MNKQIVQSGLIIFTARLQGVIIEFFAERIESVIYEGNNALGIAIPAVVIKYEHRDYHRVKIPKDYVTICYIPNSAGK